MTAAQVKALIEERNKMRAMLQSVDAELSRALLVWSRENGYFLAALTPEQFMREMEKANA